MVNGNDWNKDRSVKVADAEPQEMPVLFIGGPHDGKRIGMDSLPTTVNMPYTKMPKFGAAGELSDEAVPVICKALYRREAMSCKAGVYPIYVFHDIPAEDVVYTLLEGYRESEEDRATKH